MLSNYNPHKRLVGTKNGTATLKSCLAVISLTINIYLPCDPATLLLGISPRDMKVMLPWRSMPVWCSLENLCMLAYSSSIYHSPKLDTSHRSFICTIETHKISLAISLKYKSMGAAGVSYFYMKIKLQVHQQVVSICRHRRNVRVSEHWVNTQTVAHPYSRTHAATHLNMCLLFFLFFCKLEILNRDTQNKIHTYVRKLWRAFQDQNLSLPRYY